MALLGHGIVPTPAERVASEDAPGAQKESVDDAMSPKCFDGILGAGGIESAILAKPGGQPALVEADYANQHLNHPLRRRDEASASSFVHRLRSPAPRPPAGPPPQSDTVAIVVAGGYGRIRGGTASRDCALRPCRPCGIPQGPSWSLAAPVLPDNRRNSDPRPCGWRKTPRRIQISSGFCPPAESCFRRGALKRRGGRPMELRRGPASSRWIGLSGPALQDHHIQFKP